MDFKLLNTFILFFRVPFYFEYTVYLINLFHLNKVFFYVGKYIFYIKATFYEKNIFTDIFFKITYLLYLRTTVLLSFDIIILPLHFVEI